VKISLDVLLYSMFGLTVLKYYRPELFSPGILDSIYFTLLIFAGIFYTIALIIAAIGLAVIINFVKDDKTKLKMNLSSLNTLGSKVKSAVTYLTNLALIIFSFLVGNWYIAVTFLLTICLTTIYLFYNDKVKVKTAIIALSTVQESN